MLTPEQRLKLKSAGYSDVKINAFEAQKTTKEAQTAQQPGYLDRVKSDFQTRREEVKNINAGNASLPEKILQNAGQVAGGAADLVAEAPGIKQGLDLVGKGVGQVAKVPGIKQGVELGMETYNKLPENIRKDLEAVVNIASLAPVGFGAKGGLKAGEVALDAVKTGSKAVKTGAKAVGKVSGEIIPTADRIVNSQVSKALDLTAGDIKNINLSTGNEVGEFLARKNLIRGNKAETTTALKDFFDTNYKTVRDEIGKVKTTYKQEAVPRYKQALQEIQKQVGETTGLESTAQEIKTLLKKKDVSLDDVQRAKELLDEHFSLYKVTGDIKEGATKQGLTNLRKDLKDFIEKEVQSNSGTDIRALNNEVSTAKSTLNAIEARSTRGLTASNIKIGDLGVFGVGSMFGGPLVGVAALAAKKILGTSAVRLKFAKWVDGISDARKVMLREKLLKGEVPEEVSKLLNQFSESKNQNIAKKARAKKDSISGNTTSKGLKVKGESISPVKSDPLITEARKYKSAEEFVKAKGEPLYHGTSGQGATDISTNGFKITDKGNAGSGVSLSSNKNISSEIFAGKSGKVIESFLAPDAKLMDGTKFDSIITDLVKNKKMPYKTPQEQSIVDSLAAKQAQKLGFDGVDWRKSGDGIESLSDEVRVWNTDKVKTKSQLTDIYNQAHGKIKK